MAIKGDCSGAGPHVAPCNRAIKRVGDNNPNLDVSINAGWDSGQVTLNFTAPGKYFRQVRVSPTLDMEDSIFTALEQALKSK